MVKKLLTVSLILMIFFTGCGKNVENEDSKIENSIREETDNKENVDSNIDEENIEKTYLEVVYLDPTNLKKTCLEKDSKSTTGVKEGCMKWYVFKMENGVKTAILDHNTTSVVDGFESALEQLKLDTSNWDKGLNARLITANEVAFITGNDNFDSNDEFKDDWFYFDSNTKDKSTGNNLSKYAWMYDYTKSCKKYGCNIEDNSANSNYGYWTSDKVINSSYAWRVDSFGSLYYDTPSSSTRGIRPVITIN